MNLYHYCSNSEFYSIISNRSIWLSSLSLSNDSMEGKLVADLVLEMAKADKFSEMSIKRLQDSISALEKTVEGLGFCLSEESDSLSQWRGYADDASGVSIGFSKSYLDKLSKASLNPQESGFTLQKVEYDRDAQKKLIRPTYDRINELIKKDAIGALYRDSWLAGLDLRRDVDAESLERKKVLQDLYMAIFTLFTSLFLLKTNAFQEEREWRLLSYLAKISEDRCLFRPSLDKIIPYRMYSLLNFNDDPIIKIVLGPKNRTPECFIDTFLKQNEFKNVSVIRSKASYR